MSTEKQHFFVRLGARPEFDTTMTADERTLMLAHAVHWKALFDAGRVVVYGPVLEATGAWGMGVVEAEALAAIEHDLANDPAIKAKVLTLEIIPMRVGAVRPVAEKP